MGSWRRVAGTLKSQTVDDRPVSFQPGLKLVSPCPFLCPSLPPQEENFTEAVSNAHKVWAPPSVPSELRAILADPAADTITAKVGGLWWAVRCCVPQEAQRAASHRGRPSSRRRHRSTQQTNLAYSLFLLPLGSRPTTGCWWRRSSAS